MTFRLTDCARKQHRTGIENDGVSTFSWPKSTRKFAFPYKCEVRVFINSLAAKGG